MHAIPILSVLLCVGATATAQSGRSVGLLAPTVLGQTARFVFYYPPSAFYNSYALMASVAPMAGTVPLTVPGFTVLGSPSVDPQTAMSTFAGQLGTTGTVTHTLPVPNHAALIGTAIDMQSMDWSIPFQTIAFSDNELVMALEARRWSTPLVASTTGRGQARMAANAQGAAMAVWLENRSVDPLVSSRYVPGVGWTPSAVVVPTSSATYPDVVIDAAGNAIAVWEELGDIRSSRCTPTGSWTPSVLLETGAGAAGNPRVAVDAAGNAIAVWWQSDGAWNSGVVSMFAARFVPGQGWGAAVAIENDNQAWGDAPSIACDAAGNATAVWRWSYPSGGNWLSTVMTNRYTPGLGWGTATPATNDTSISNNQAPEVAVAPNGDAFALWETLENYSQVHAARWHNGSWGATVRLDPPGNTSSLFPRIALDGNGNGIAVWSEADGLAKLLAAPLQNGTFGPAEVAVSTGTWARYPAVVVDAGGRVTIAFMHGQPGTMTTLHFATRYLPGIGWLSPYQIDDGLHSGAGLASLGIDAAGNILALLDEQWFNGSRKVVTTEFR